MVGADGAAFCVLGLETSCDETACAVLRADGSCEASGLRLLSNVVASQVDLHKRFGGVVPEVASRRHVETIIPVIDQALGDAGLRLSDVTAVAATRGPGLVGAILVGLSAAKALALARQLPFVAVNHIEAHMYANFLEHPDLRPPFVCLVVSGGHTDLVYLRDHGSYEVMGRTRDDAAGEAFDKVARVLGLGYPGGPAIDAAARSGDPEAVRFPRAFLEEGSYDFSFSGLKTAVLNHVRKVRTGVADVASSFQEAVVGVLVEKTVRAALETGVKIVALAGGVAANSRLRERMAVRASEAGLRLVFPSPGLCTDNAAMVACAGYFRLIRGKESPLDVPAIPDLDLES
ncbi:MAG TPA: tRNA (adenosine(37)-N6)-threonylcarbamoyltransferase complex transferase subunit TsaD [Firmicutes bacterium]|nr:tRNA (adenosine(37)-N6)-threonylcarbamoyltransferase complex transferase subunit TsaD [Bacillota bacterium]